MVFSRKLLYASVSIPAILIASSASALPQGGQIAAGSATITNSGVATTITQGSGRAVLDWRSFDVGAGEQVVFQQPSAAAIALNRIHDQKPSDIFGRLKANGQVILSNPNGFLFGPTCQIDVAGLVATTADTRAADFMRGGLLDLNRPGNSDAAIINRGSITARDAGLVALIAPHVENSGSIIARLGSVQLAGAETATVDLYGDGLLSLAVTAREKAVSLVNTGRVAAGRIFFSAADAMQLVQSLVNTDGVLEASNARTSMDGTLVFGGSIAVIGRDVGLGENARLHADGRNGGGSIAIGGGWQGSGLLAHAESTTIARGATLTANATRKGDGGTVVAWSDNATRFDGTIDARGGPNGGAGGRVETSSKKMLGVTGTVDASAPSGKGGDWLLDPTNVTITQSGGTDITAGGCGAGPYACADLSVSADSISTGLGGGNNVTITATGDITLSNAAVTKGGGGDATLTLKAEGSILTTGTDSIVSNSGKLHTILWSDAEVVPNLSGSISLRNTTITSNGGDIVLGGGLDDGANGGTASDNRPDNAAWGNATVNFGIELNNSPLNAGIGNIRGLGHGRNNAGSSNLYGIYAVNSSLSTTSEGSVTLHGTGGDGSSQNHGIFLDGGASITTIDGDISLTGDGGSGASGSNFGVRIDSATVASTGVGASAGNIILSGTGGGVGGAGNFNYGLNLGGTLSTADGNMTATGHGGAATGLAQAGAYIYGTLISSGAGDITIAGDGGDNGTDTNWGVYVTGGTSRLQVNEGDLSVTGAGGDGSGNDNSGIKIENGAQVVSAGVGASAGNITLTGVGGAGATANDGIVLANGTATIATIDGDISLTGSSNGTVAANFGILFTNDVGIISTGTGASAGNITLTGIGGNGTVENDGIIINNCGWCLETIDGDVTVTGTGGGGLVSYGIRFDNDSDIRSTGTGTSAGDFTFIGTAGDVVAGESIGIGLNAYLDATTIDGAITFLGTGGNSGSSVSHGISAAYGSRITSTGNSVDTKPITLTGIANEGVDNNYGIDFLGDGSLNPTTGIHTVAAGISLSGTGGDNGHDNYGVYLRYGANIQSSGSGPLAGDITIDGTGGVGAWFNYGVLIQASETRLGVVDGDLRINGVGANGTLWSNRGISIEGATVASTGVGASAGNIVLTGTAGTGVADNYGVNVSNTATVTTIDGDLAITGTGGNGTNDSNYGINVNNAQIQSTGTGASAGNIILDGTAGSGNRFNYGINTVGGAALSVVAGDLQVTGHGGNGAAGNSNGVTLSDTAIASTGSGLSAGNIGITGTGGNDPGGNSYGIYTVGTTSITADDGTIALTGQGNALAGGDANFGLWVASSVATSGDGDITLDGTGGGGVNNSTGVYMTGALTSADGDIAVSGTGGTATGRSEVGTCLQGLLTATGQGSISVSGHGGDDGTDSSFGVWATGGATTISVADGSISIDGTGGAGSTNLNHGVFLDSITGLESTGGGTIALRGTRGDTDVASYDIYLSGGAQTIGGAGATGSQIWTADRVSLANFTAETAGDITVKTRSLGQDIHLAGGAGGLDLSSGVLGQLVAGSITIGQAAGTGTVTLGAYAWDDPARFMAGPTGSIVVSGAQTSVAASDATLRFSGPTTLGSTINISNATAGTQAVTFDGPLTLGVDSSINAGGGDIAFGDRLDGAHNLSLVTSGDVAFADEVGGTTRLGAIGFTGTHDLSAADNVYASDFSYAAGAGNVNLFFLNTTADIAIDTTGNINGSYRGQNGLLHSAAGSLMATVDFDTLDITGISATLAPGRIGAAAAADQAMANRISIGGVSFPALMPNPAYRFASYVIGGTFVPPSSTGGSHGSTPAVPILPAPPETVATPPVVASPHSAGERSFMLGSIPFPLAFASIRASEANLSADFRANAQAGRSATLGRDGNGLYSVSPDLLSEIAGTTESREAVQHQDY